MQPISLEFKNKICLKEFNLNFEEKTKLQKCWNGCLLDNTIALIQSYRKLSNLELESISRTEEKSRSFQTRIQFQHSIQEKAIVKAKKLIKDFSNFLFEIDEFGIIFNFENNILVKIGFMENLLKDFKTTKAIFPESYFPNILIPSYCEIVTEKFPFLSS
jgi:hypothetical protein